MSGTAPGLVSVQQIVAMLASRIDGLVTELLPNAKRAGHEWFIGSVAGEPGASMAVHRSGGKAGVWMDFATGEAGDALDLVGQVLFRGDKRLSLDWARSWLGLDGLDAARLKVTRAAVIEKARKDEDALTDGQRRDFAGRLFRGAQHRIAATPVERYLTGRGIDLRRFGKQPGALAYGERVKCKELGDDAVLPAMLACIMRRSQLAGVHRTWLEVRPDGSVGKARLRDAKKSLGPYLGGVIPLWRGGSKLGWSELWDCDLDIDWDGREADWHVTLAEGIENALSVAMASPGRRIAATVSLANMAAVELPPCVRVVTIAADNDAEGSKAATIGLPRAIAALQARGLEVRIARAPLPHKDFNDWLQALEAESGDAGADASDGREAAA